MKKLVFFSILLLVFYSTNGSASKPTLKINGNERTLSFSRSALLARKDATTIEIPEDPAYPNKKMNYRVVPVASLFNEVKIPASATIQFECMDGFSAPISKDQLLNVSPEGSIAYIAVEPAHQKWPSLKPGVNDKTAGPFYLVWKNPKKSKIGTEEWPFQLAGFTVKESTESRFPNIAPRSKLAGIDRGYKIFLKNCFACHTMNREGESQLGPDLNVPMNPIEYLGEENLKKQIRNPQDLRTWPQARMNGFSEAVISNDELNDLVAYLKQMATQKAPKK